MNNKLTRYLVLPRVLPICAVYLSALLNPGMARAVTAMWDAPANISKSSEVSTEGALFGAWAFRSSNLAGGITVNGVPFTQVVLPSGTSTSGASGTSGDLTYTYVGALQTPSAGQTAQPFQSFDAVYKKLIIQSAFKLNSVANPGSTFSLTFNNLSPNQTYQVQFWCNYSGASGPLTTFTIAGVVSPPVATNVTSPAANGGLGQYITGQFTTGAAETSATVTVASQTGNYQFVSAVQVRAVHKTAWFKNSKYGVGVSWRFLPAGINGSGDGSDTLAMNDFVKIPSGGDRSAYAQIVDDFNVPAFVEQVRKTGAGYVIFPVGFNTGLYCSPNSVYESLTNSAGNKLENGEFTSKRDLIKELGVALNAHGIKLIVYIPAEGPMKAYYLQRTPSTSKLYPGTLTHARDGLSSGVQKTAYSEAFRTIFHAMIAEWSSTWGSNVAGWWIDGVYHDSGYRYAEDCDNEDPVANMSALIAATKAGNGGSLVAPNVGVNRFGALSEDQDYTAGEEGRYQDERGKMYEYPSSEFLTFGTNTKILNHYYSYLGTWWSSTDRKYVDEEIVSFIDSVNKQGGVVSLSVGIDQTGEIGDISMAQFERIKAALRPTVAPVVTPDPIPVFTNLALFKPAHLRGYLKDITDVKEIPGLTQEQQQPHSGVDGDSKTWATTAAANRINFSYIVDLESDLYFDRAVITFQDGYFSTQYKIEYATAAAPNSWSLLDTTQSFYYNSTAGTKVHNADSVKYGRYVRISSQHPSGAGQTGNRMGVKEFGVYNLSGTQPTSKETVWFDEEFPAGSVEYTGGSGSWQKASTLDTTPITWASLESAGVPHPLHGVKLRWNKLVSGWNEHGFTGSSDPLRVGVNDTLYCDVYLDPINPPDEIMLIWRDAAGSSEHRAYWGADLLGVGTPNTDSRRFMGSRPTTGQWVRLSVPAAQVGLGGVTVTGMGFSTSGGRTFFDRVGKIAP